MEIEFVRDLEGWTGYAALYKLSKEVTYDDLTSNYIIVSATRAFFTGPETYIFFATETGEEISFQELPGSYRGGLSHNEALEGFKNYFSNEAE